MDLELLVLVFQVIYRVLVNSFDIDLAVQSPRIHHQFLPHIVFYDPHRISQDVLDNLKKKGHKLKTWINRQSHCCRQKKR